jgi:hypothetical protein
MKTCGVSKRERGRTRHRLLVAHLDLNKLRRVLHGDAVCDDRVRCEDVQAIAVWNFGGCWLAGHLWRDFSVEATLDRLGSTQL